MTDRVWTAEEVRALGVRTDLVTAGSVLGIGRTAAHELARRHAFPVPLLRIGTRYVVPTAPLLELLGIDTEHGAATTHDTAVTPPRLTCTDIAPLADNQSAGSAPDLPPRAAHARRRPPGRRSHPPPDKGTTERPDHAQHRPPRTTAPAARCLPPRAAPVRMP